MSCGEEKSKQPYVNPEGQAYLNSTVGSPPLEDISIPDFRKLIAQLQAHDPIPGVEVVEFDVPFNQHGVKNVKTFIFRPADAGDKKLPTLFYVHGGGWVSGDHFTHDNLMRQLCLLSGAAIVFVEYSLAPEKKFPVQNEECFAAVKYFVEHGKEHDLKTDKVAIVGDSAGGQLAPAVIQLAQTHRLKTKFVYQVLFSPIVNLENIFDRLTFSERQLFNIASLDVPVTRKWIEAYIPSEKDRESSLASPLNMSEEVTKRFPPTLVVASAVDILRDDGQAFGKKLQKAGVSCSVIQMEFSLHDAVLLEPTRTGPTAQTAIRAAASELSNALFASENGKGAEKHAAKGNGTRSSKRRRI